MKTICIFGTGSLGANIAINIARRWAQDVAFVFVDYDTIESVNLANQPWYDVNVGQRKASVLAAHVYKIAKSTSVVISKKVTKSTSFISEFETILKDVDLFIDCFDTMKSRALTQAIARRMGIPILHAGFSETVCMVRWGTEYPINTDVTTRAPVCDRRDLGTLVVMGAGLVSFVVSAYIQTGAQLSRLLEIKDDITIW